MSFLTEKRKRELGEKANTIRQSVIEMLFKAGSGHTAGSLGMADIFTLLYFHILKHDPKNPKWNERDRVILSNGHIGPVLYATLAQVGYFQLEELQTLRKFGSRLQGHPHREFLPVVETSSGPLGSGLSQAVGMALADRIDKKENDRKIFCLISDGELNEGNTWEGIMLAGKYKLKNLIVIVDRNYIQIDGNTEDIMPLEPLKAKWESFNWHTQEVSGHDFEALNRAFTLIDSTYDKPSVIIAKTIPGKGVKEFEKDYKWHGKAPNKEERDRAMKELQNSAGRYVVEE